MNVYLGPLGSPTEAFLERLVTLNAPVSDMTGGYFLTIESILASAFAALSLIASLVFSWISSCFLK